MNEPMPANVSSSKDTYEILTEQFQKDTQEFVRKCDKKQLGYIRDCVYAREDELRKEEREQEMKKDNKSKKPNAIVEFTTEGMPQ